MRAIIADDEILLVEELSRLLAKLWPELEIIGSYDNGTDALHGMNSMQPDIAFLDIQMPGLDGLEVASQAPPEVRIVFITAFDQYAVEAFDKNAIDYLLKPVQETRLAQTIQRLQDSSIQTNINMNALVDKIRRSIGSEPHESLTWIKALKGEVVHMIHVNDVVYFHAEHKYTTAYTLDAEYTLRASLNKLEEMLDANQFWRVHRGTIVNVNYIKSSKRTRDGRCTIQLKESNKELDVSRAYAHLFKQL